jgi:TolB protein
MSVFSWRRIPRLSFPHICLTAFVALVVGAAGAKAQDSIPPIEQGVRLGITYTPGMRPGMLVLGGSPRAMLDSVRTILQRDLEYSDRFEMIFLPGGDSLVLGVRMSPTEGDANSTSGSSTAEPFVNYSLYAALGADYAVSVLSDMDSSFSINLYAVRGEEVRTTVRLQEMDPHSGDFRMAVHRAADVLVRAATGEQGIAASRVAFIANGRVYSVDSDGAGRQAISPPGTSSFSPVWDPAATRVVYTKLADDGWGSIIVYDFAAGTRSPVPNTEEYLNYSSAISPDGRILAFTRSWAEGSDLFAYNLAQDCCLQRLTVGRLSDNVSPEFSPDGRRITFGSTRSGTSQIYVMASDGTGQELFAPFDYGVTGASHSPAWSPDGLNLAFHRSVAGRYQLFLMDIRTRTVRQLTSAGRNEDPTWAPDSRHIAFKSSRAGSEQIWVVDIDTGRVRQLARVGAARMPNWSAPVMQTNQP